MNPNKPGKSDNPQEPREQKPSGEQQQAASGAGGQYGEGNYAATRQYNEGLKRHLETSDVEQEARDAAPKSASEEREMLEAEEKGKNRGRGEESPGGEKDDQ